MKKIVLALFLMLGLSGCALAADPTYVDSQASLYAALANIATSSDIVLSNDITLSSSYAGMIDATSPATIRGGYAIDGNSAYRAFSIVGGNVTFTNITFRNNSGSVNGGAVAVSGATTSVAFNGCRFEGNKTTGVGSGGAVSVADGTVVFDSTTTFSGNSTMGTGNGGAVNVAGGTVTFNGNMFANNTAVGNGGALNLAVAVTFNGTLNFTGNSAVNGGAIAATVTLNLGNTFNFTDNNATANGGAVYGGTLNVSGGIFTGNNATGSGGAVYGTASVTVSSGTFTNNGRLGGVGAAATGSGGAIGSGGAVNVNGGTFTGNEAVGNGGAVAAGAPSTISGGSFANNIAGGSGGAIYNSTAVKITGGGFVSNRSTSSAANSGGGAVFANGIDVTPSAASMTFDGQEAQKDGGALYSSSTLTLTNVIFFTNKAVAGSGGAAYSAGASTFTNCVFGDVAKGNIAGNGGGAYAGELTATATTFRANVATSGAGGAVFIEGGAGMTSDFTSCLFELNQAKQDGGAVFLLGDSTTEFYTTVFDGNYAEGKGGAVALGGTLSVFSRCTFTNNGVKANATAQGGAAHVVSKTFKFGNCTFVGNEAGSGMGGALSLGGGTTGNSVVFYCTFTDNLAGGGQGGAIYSAAATLNLGVSALVGNTASFGEDIFRSGGTINSDGYNILGDYGVMGAGGPSGNVDWMADPSVTRDKANDFFDPSGVSYTRALSFGTNAPAPNIPAGGAATVTGSSLSMTRTLDTLALVPTTAAATNPALDAILGTRALNLFNSYFAGFSPHTDERGVSRPVPSGGNCDVGAYESGDGVIPPPPPSDNIISYVKMSGIPNTMVKIGQTCSLTALVYYQDGSSSSAEGVVWSSSKPHVAKIDAFGNLVALMQGTTAITVTTDRLDANNQHATDSATLTVSDEMSYTNIHPDVAVKLGTFNTSMQQYTEQLYFVDANPSEVSAASFQSAFKSAYGISPAQVTELQNANAIAFNSKGSYSGNNWSSAKPSINVSLSSLSAGGGSLLPLRYTYSLSWDEVSAIMERKVTKIDNVAELFGRLKLVFESVNGTTSPVVDADGEFGVAVSQATSSGALVVTNGNNGLTLTLTVMLSDVASTQSSLVGNKLVVPDGVADGTASGAMWLLKRTGGNSGDNNKASEGGGGCNQGSGLLSALALGVSAALKRKVR